ncbi:MAG: AAA family ATPase [Acidimicrobiales bacterium]
MIGDARRPDPARRFPFCAVIGQPDAQLALLLAAIDPAIGGVLLRGDKGSARSTLAQGLAGLLPGAARFVDVSLGVTEDRVLGSLDTTSGPIDGETQFRAGLLAAAHGGVLHLSAVNLLPEHLVEVLLDVATSGVNRVERNGIWHEHPAHFVLVASMDPDAGELRPQLLDRFGMSVDVTTPADPAVRSEVVRRRLTHDSGALVHGHEGDIVLRARLAAAMPADLPTSVVDLACHLAAGLGAEGLRGDLVLCRAAAAFAGWEGRSITTEADLERVAPLALAHRRRRRPFHTPALAPGELERALAAARQAFVTVGDGAAGSSADEPTDQPSSDADRSSTATATSGTANAADDSPPAAAADQEGDTAAAADQEGDTGDTGEEGDTAAATDQEGDTGEEGDTAAATDQEGDTGDTGEEGDTAAATDQEGDTGEAPPRSPVGAGQDRMAAPAVDAGEPPPSAGDGGELPDRADDGAAEPPPPPASTGEPAAQGS